MKAVIHPISVSLEPPDAIAALKLRAAIDEMCAKDATLGVATRPVNEIVLMAVSELRLEIAVDILERGKGLDFTTGAPQVAYRESITRKVAWDYVHKKQTGGKGEYAKIKIRFEPGEPGSGLRFANEAGDSVPAAFVPAIEKGLAGACEVGPVAGFPMDLACALIDGGYHDVDSNERTFEIAGRACLREALPKAGPRILEPMMLVIVLTPPVHIGDVIGDLNSRRGQVQEMDDRYGTLIVTALVPLSNLFGYVSTLKSMTRGRAESMMAFERYEQVPPYRGPDDDNFPPAIGMRA
ncbi:MAG TPA: hypothetical protein VGQ35_21215 [Dongiaceae bacterium]|jgi:elongation factor G|nr:hypothetical protein [Dongiaceae bacterium]